MWMVPGGTTIPGGNPEIALPGLTPRFPVSTVGPVLVTAAPPKTANDAAVPRDGAVAADTVCNIDIESTAITCGTDNIRCVMSFPSDIQPPSDNPTDLMA